MVELFDRQYNMIINNMEEYKSNHGLETKDLSDREIEEMLFDVNEEAEYFMEQGIPYYEETIRDFGQSSIDNLDIAQTAIDFDLDNPRVENFLRVKEQHFAENVNETTWEGLKGSLIEGVREGESIPDLENRVTDIFDGAKANRSEMIARTEVNGSANLGAYEGYRQTGVVERKTWLSALDERTRPAHRQAHNQTVDMDKNFTVKNESLEYPGDPSGSASNIINCRCTLLPVTEESDERETPEYIPNELNDSFDADGNFNREGHKEHLNNIYNDYDQFELNDDEELKLEMARRKYNYTDKVNHQINKNILRENDMLEDRSMRIRTNNIDGDTRVEVMDNNGMRQTITATDNLEDFIDEFNNKSLYEQLQDYDEIRYRNNIYDEAPLDFNKPDEAIMDRFEDELEMKKAQYIVDNAFEEIDDDDVIDEMRETILKNHKGFISNDDVDNILDEEYSSFPNQDYEDRVNQAHDWLTNNVDNNYLYRLEDRVEVTFKDDLGALGRYNPQINGIQYNSSKLGVGPEDTTYIHEMLHAVHEQNMEVRHHIRGFFIERTEDIGAEFQRLNGYNNIRGYEAGFMNNYMGRVYNDSTKGTEVVSKGVEFMHRKELEFFKEHISEFNTVLSIMRGIAY
ncbi:MAG: phage head morphogenesis protein [Halanaerobiales bacterium]|nr:phage head morphogenesis protein [Halanaerobiales bacterium]